jgi:hypothetical protein
MIFHNTTLKRNVPALKWDCHAMVHSECEDVGGSRYLRIVDVGNIHVAFNQQMTQAPF